MIPAADSGGASVVTQNTLDDDTNDQTSTTQTTTTTASMTSDQPTPTNSVTLEDLVGTANFASDGSSIYGRSAADDPPPATTPDQQKANAIIAEAPGATSTDKLRGLNLDGQSAGVVQAVVNDPRVQGWIADASAQATARYQGVTDPAHADLQAGQTAKAIADTVQGMNPAVATAVVRLDAIDVAVDVTTASMPPMSLVIRDCTSPVRVRVKNAIDWRCR